PGGRRHRGLQSRRTAAGRSAVQHPGTAGDRGRGRRAAHGARGLRNPLGARRGADAGERGKRGTPRPSLGIRTGGRRRGRRSSVAGPDRERDACGNDLDWRLMRQRVEPSKPGRYGPAHRLPRMTELAVLRDLIDAAFERRAELTPQNVPQEVDAAIEACLTLLDSGAARVAEPLGGEWIVNEWLKKAVLLSFRVRENRVMDAGYTRFYDKVPLKYAQASEAQLREGGARIVPHAVVRRGAYLGPNVVLMPSYVNVGAWVGPGTMVDTWATVGSCAQIGRNVHLSGGVGIGGVLEPLQATPTIIENDCFIGARSEIVEGVVVEAGSVISMGVFIGQSTRIYDRSSGQVLQGRIPAGSVVVPGTLPSADGRYGLYCAVIVKRVDAQTRAKTSINDLLRSAEDFESSRARQQRELI